MSACDMGSPKHVLTCWHLPNRKAALTPNIQVCMIVAVAVSVAAPLRQRPAAATVGAATAMRMSAAAAAVLVPRSTQDGGEPACIGLVVRVFMLLLIAAVPAVAVRRCHAICMAVRVGVSLSMVRVPAAAAAVVGM